ncbi:unnamed protein product [Aphanomyces euteiches]|uniref:Glutamine amidotransferase type-2 domain-containing protein n=1 Tax=Aphanomyces euteiches TaxID=100861 RepID=A0A6G0WGP8_9STRA|nr:hypothetical protein Ae201684_015424 [Aphanomyces euteiches]KAF0726310.1 hypothetical protein Ae201684_015425 [Aphanomyces euteiches]KAH9097567.1 hypothetical protein Ae201684P_001045 [Aphanomyces euteiches]KAH9097656.1 hypothetical protein Ae201684P_001132 [Aphanomyces euteiches]
MCGIVAYFDLTPSATASTPPPDLGPALDLIYHRGPDGQGVWTAPGVGLGHARLSIMDVQHGAQPMHDETNSIHAVVNGEFYDFEAIRADLESQGHVFKTRSDSEILIHLYKEHGLNCFDYLQGEFAFVLYDSIRQRLIVCRDRYGVKPLFYTVVNNRLMVASEAKAFLAMGWKPEWDVASIADNGIFSDTRTLFRGVSKVRPASYLTVTASGTITTDIYFEPDFPDKTIPDPRSVDEMIEGVRARLLESVRCRLRSDVPVAVYLSGGIDSSSVMGMALSVLREKNPDATIDVFTIAFDDKLVHGEQFDESLVAERSAKYFNAKFNVLHAKQELMTDAFDDAFLLSKYVRDAGYKVVLTGEGSDEHFAGYEFFQHDLVREPTTPPTLSDAFRHAELARRDEAHRVKVSQAKEPSLDEYFEGGRRLVNNTNAVRNLNWFTAMVPQLFVDKSVSSNPGEAFALSLTAIERQKAKTKWHPLHTALCIETRTFLPNYLSNHVGDRCEMAHSIEGRVPFLDYRLTTYVNGLPPQVKIPVDEATGTFTEKWILREAVKPFVSPEIYERVKMRFMAPPSEFDPEAYHWKKIKSRVTEQAVKRLGWMDWSFVDGLMTRFMTSNDPFAERLLNVVMSFIVMQERFGVATWVSPSQSAQKAP